MVIDRSERHVQGTYIEHIQGSTVYIGPPQPISPSTEELLGRGQALLEAGEYKESARLFREALSAEPSSARASLLLALAQLEGRNPEVLPQRVVAQAERCLIAALRDENVRPAALVVLGVIKHDRYVVNGMDEGEPRLSQIAAEVRNVQLTASDRELLAHLKASKRAREWLGIDL